MKNIYIQPASLTKNQMGVSTVQLGAPMETIMKIGRERLNALRGYSTIVEKNT